MALANAEWWTRAAARPRPEVSVGDKLRQAAELMAANIGQAFGRLANPPYQIPDGKPLKIHFCQPGESPFPPAQIEQLTAIAKMFQEKT